MDRSAGVARLVSDAVAHELANQMQPVLTALRAAGKAEPTQRAAMLEMAREAVQDTLELAEALRRAAAPSAMAAAPLPEVAELVKRALPQEIAERLACTISDPGGSAAAEPAVAALLHLLRHAARLAGPQGALELVLGGLGPRLLVRFGGPSPSRDDAGAAQPLIDVGRGTLRMGPPLAMAAMICAGAWGSGSLRVAHGDRSGRLEIWTEAAP